MTGRPRRLHAKRDVHIHIHDDIYLSIQPLLADGSCAIESFSSLVETIIFLSLHMYAEEQRNGFVVRLAELKTQKTLEYIEQRDSNTTRCVHMTLDTEALDFLDMLTMRYSALFESRSMTLDLLLCNIGNGCDTSDGVRYYGNRLNEVLKLHPKHMR